MIDLAFLAVALAVGWAIPVHAEPSVGITGGFALSGDQDVTIVDRSAAGVNSSDSKDVNAAIGPVAGVTAMLWRGHFGLQFDGLYWGTSAPGVEPGSQKRLRVRQDRGAMLGSFLGRAFIAKPGGTFVYGGLGAGASVLDVRPGHTGVVPAVGALGGVAVPVTPHLRIRAEVRYLLTRDMDPWAGEGKSTEISGSPGPNPGRALFGPHFDTQFVPVLVGVDYLF